MTGRWAAWAAIAAACVLLAAETVAAGSAPVSFPVHGNWCGPGDRAAPGGAPRAPVDVLDAACMRHDLCYERRGTLDCGCDIALLEELRATRYPDPHLWNKARAVYDFFSLSPCNGMAAVTKPRYLFLGLSDDVRTGGPSPLDVPLRMFELGKQVPFGDWLSEE